MLRAASLPPPLIRRDGRALSRCELEDQHSYHVALVDSYKADRIPQLES